MFNDFLYKESTSEDCCAPKLRSRTCNQAEIDVLTFTSSKSAQKEASTEGVVALLGKAGHTAVVSMTFDLHYHSPEVPTHGLLEQQNSCKSLILLNNQAYKINFQD